MYVCGRVCVVSVCVCVVYECMHVYACVYNCVYVWLGVCTCMYMCTCVRACVRACVRVYNYVLQHIYTPYLSNTSLECAVVSMHAVRNNQLQPTCFTRVVSKTDVTWVRVTRCGNSTRDVISMTSSPWTRFQHPITRDGSKSKLA